MKNAIVIGGLSGVGKAIVQALTDQLPHALEGLAKPSLTEAVRCSRL